MRIGKIIYNKKLMYAFVENDKGVEVYCSAAHEKEANQWAKDIYIRDIKKLEPVICSGWGYSSKQLYEIFEDELADEVKGLIKVGIFEP
jgi:hypothetical protein